MRRIQIHCTNQDKLSLMDSLTGVCPFDSLSPPKNCADENTNCTDCVDMNIEFVIKESE